MTNIACHPRVAQLRGYPKPVKASLPKQYIQITPKTYRSSTHRSPSAANYREQLAVMIGVHSPSTKLQVNKHLPLPRALDQNIKNPQPHSTYRVPFRNTQNDSNEPVEFQPLFPVNPSARYQCGPPLRLPLQDQDQDKQQPAPKNSHHCDRTYPRVYPTPIPSNTPSYRQQAAFRSPSDCPPSSTPRGVFPSGFIDDVYGCSSLSHSSSPSQPTRDHGSQAHWENARNDSSYAEDHKMDEMDDIDEMDEHPQRPSSRMGFYPSFSAYDDADEDDDDTMDDQPLCMNNNNNDHDNNNADHDDGDNDADYMEEQEVTQMILEEEEEVTQMILEERDISDADPFAFDSDFDSDMEGVGEDEMEMTRELIGILDF